MKSSIAKKPTQFHHCQHRTSSLTWHLLAVFLSFPIMLLCCHDFSRQSTYVDLFPPVRSKIICIIDKPFYTMPTDQIYRLTISAGLGGAVITARCGCRFITGPHCQRPAIPDALHPSDEEPPGPLGLVQSDSTWYDRGGSSSASGSVTPPLSPYSWGATAGRGENEPDHSPNYTERTPLSRVESLAHSERLETDAGFTYNSHYETSDPLHEATQYATTEEDDAVKMYTPITPYNSHTCTSPVPSVIIDTAVSAYMAPSIVSVKDSVKGESFDEQEIAQNLAATYRLSRVGEAELPAAEQEGDAKDYRHHWQQQEIQHQAELNRCSGCVTQLKDRSGTRRLQYEPSSLEAGHRCYHTDDEPEAEGYYRGCGTNRGIAATEHAQCANLPQCVTNPGISQRRQAPGLGMDTPGPSQAVPAYGATTYHDTHAFSPTRGFTPLPTPSSRIRSSDSHSLPLIYSSSQPPTEYHIDPMCIPRPESPIDEVVTSTPYRAYARFHGLGEATNHNEGFENPAFALPTDIIYSPSMGESTRPGLGPREAWRYHHPSHYPSPYSHGGMLPHVRHVLRDRAVPRRALEHESISFWTVYPRGASWFPQSRRPKRVGKTIMLHSIDTRCYLDRFQALEEAN
jgi:hypothetical protein